MADNNSYLGIALTCFLSNGAFILACYYYYKECTLRKFASIRTDLETLIPHRSTTGSKRNQVSVHGTVEIPAAGVKSSKLLLSHLQDAKQLDLNRQLEPDEQIITSEVRIAKKSVGLFIGKLGSNIKHIQKESDSVMYLNDIVFDNGDRVCVIRGKKSAVRQAEELIAKFFESLRSIECKEILVPKQCVGRIIGQDGRRVRSIEEKSQATVFVDLTRTERRSSNDHGQEHRFAVLKGTKEQIRIAEQLIEKQVEEFQNIQQSKVKGKITDKAVLPPVRSFKSANHIVSHDLVTAMSPEMFRVNGKMQVFVSCVYHPNMFWIQIISKESLDLRRLSDAMTEYYYHKSRRRMEIETCYKPGDIVAAPFHWDGKMYRARVLDVKTDEIVEIEYVDYGDRRTVKSHWIRPLQMKFMRPQFQAVQASLNLHCPVPGWPEELIFHFCNLSYCAKWKSLTAKVHEIVMDANYEKITRLHLELMDEDKNVGVELLQKANSWRTLLWSSGVKGPVHHNAPRYN